MVIGAIVQARLGSSRLPGKVLMPLPFDGKNSIVGKILEELKKVKSISRIILATSTNPENRVLREVANENEVDYFAGDETNVLRRFTDVIKKYDLDVAIRITADNPIIDIQLMEKMISWHLESNCDYSYSVNLPLGMNMEVCKANSLLEVEDKKDLTDEDMEHVTNYFTRTESGFTTFYPVLCEHKLTDRIRLTVDYPSDYAVLNIVAQIGMDKGLEGMNLVAYIDANYPWVWEINAGMFQKRHFTSVKEELNCARRLLNMHNLRHSEDLLSAWIDEESNP